MTDTGTVPVAEAAGYRLASRVRATRDLPPTRVATMDGVAVVAAESLGASPYNPVPDGLLDDVRAGDPLPPPADAVAPRESVTGADSDRHLIEEIDIGNGVCPPGQFLQRGDEPVPPGRRLRAADTALLSAMGYEEVAVYRRPAVARLYLEAACVSGPVDMLLRAVLSRNHAHAAPCPAPGAEPGDDPVGTLLRAAAGADLLLVIAGPGEGRCATAAEAIRRAGHLEAFGVGMRPGQFAGIGTVGETPVLLVPGEPVAALAVGELLAAPALRLLGHGAADDPRRGVSGQLTHKITSPLGIVDYVRVRVDNDQLHPRRLRSELDLPSLTATDGFVVVDADSEGHRAGARVAGYRDDC